MPLWSGAGVLLCATNLFAIIRDFCDSAYKREILDDLARKW